MKNKKWVSTINNDIKNNKYVRILVYISVIIYPQYPSYTFPLYMFLIYCQVKCKQKSFKVTPVPEDLLNSLIKKFATPKNYYDANNTIITNNKYLEFLGIKKYANISVRTNVKHNLRLVNIFGVDLPKNTCLMTETLYSNLKYDKNISSLMVKPTLNTFKLATEVNISLINTQNDVINAVTDVLVQNYFKSPKILYKNDIFAINLKIYGPEFFYSNHKMNEIDNVYFKCNKLKDADGKEMNGGVCLYQETTLRQSANVQTYLPKFMSTFVPRNITKVNEFQDCLIEKCPTGLNGYLSELEKCVMPFVNDDKIKLKPYFMLRGSKGSGKIKLLATLASKLGLNMFKVPMNNISATTYAQMEVALRKILFKAQLCAPCFLVMNNFENFGKNNEGQFDQRIIATFKDYLKQLLDTKTYPIILFCVSNVKDVFPDISRLFLEIFDINAPTQEERTETLKWIIASKNLSSNFDLSSVASKTHGFLYEDLEALVFYAERNWFHKFGNVSLEIVLRAEDFTVALDIMQNNYTDSLGAPKVPKVEWSDVGGLTEVKKEIIRTINLPLQHPELLKTTGLKRSGILLYGPPGTGKTLLAKAVATECGLCFLSVKGPELLNMYVGQSEKNVRDVFEKARQASPCIIFFDELDSLAPNRGVSGDSGGSMDRVVSQLLAEMDGLNQSATLFIIGATNRPDLIDPALLRPGRFDKLLYVGPCTDSPSKLSVLKALTRKFVLSKDVNLEEIVKTCPKNITGADFYGLCSNAWSNAARKVIEKIEKGEISNSENLTEKDVVVKSSDFAEAIKAVKPSISNEDLQYFEKLKLELSTNK